MHRRGKRNQLFPPNQLRQPGNRLFWQRWLSYADSQGTKDGDSDLEFPSSWLTWPKCIAAAIAVGVLAFLPVPFRLSTEGIVEPVVSVGVFAPTSGKLLEVAVVDGEPVATGDVLAKMENQEIRLQAERLRGELLAAQTDLAATRMPSPDDSNRRQNSSGRTSNSSARVAVLRSRIRSLERQVELINLIEESLIIRATRSGQVVLGDRQADSLGQAVLPSQQLMKVVDNRDGYQATIQIPANAYGYLNATLKKSAADAQASLRLRSDPSRRWVGSVSQVGNTVQLDERDEAVIEVTIDLDHQTDNDLRGDAPVVGHLWLGRRSLGFVVFRPMIEFIREMSW
jgi:multidrug efflux pump subunit AcrA (membrane-fusion protein)